MKRLSLIIVLMAIVISGYAKGLALKVYNPGTNAIFPVTSTIVYGKKDAALIDAQFQKQYAEDAVDVELALKGSTDSETALLLWITNILRKS